MLKESLPGYDVMDRSARGSTSTRLISEGGGGTDLLETYMPGIVILQIGMTECAPRLFRKKGIESFFIKKIIPRKLLSSYINYIKRTRGRNPEITDVPPEQYKYNLNNFAARCSKINSKLIIVNILNPSELFISKSPGVKRNIDLYNRISEEIACGYSNVHIVNPAEGIVNIDSICLDELHINAEGHMIYFKKIADALRLIYPV
jgi:lysophospholipase L1-like esterase